MQRGGTRNAGEEIYASARCAVVLYCLCLSMIESVQLLGQHVNILGLCSNFESDRVCQCSCWVANSLVVKPQVLLVAR